MINRVDELECYSCGIDSSGICLFHRGIRIGFKIAIYSLRKVFEEPELVPLTPEDMMEILKNEPEINEEHDYDV